MLNLGQWRDDVLIDIYSHHKQQDKIPYILCLRWNIYGSVRTYESFHKISNDF